MTGLSFLLEGAASAVDSLTEHLKESGASLTLFLVP
jgi:hypothetical protein